MNSDLMHPFVDNLSDEQKGKLRIFCELLQRENAVHNLTAINESGQIWLRHFADSLAAAEYIENHVKAVSPAIIDIGSGAGFPCLPVAIAKPYWRITSVDSTGKKINFQRMIVRQLGLQNVEIINGRAEELAHKPSLREKFDFAAARAFANLAITAEAGLGFVRLGGELLAWKSSNIAAELAEAQNIIGELGGRTLEIFNYSLAERNFVIVPIQKIAATPKKYPRAWGKIKR